MAIMRKLVLALALITLAAPRAFAQKGPLDELGFHPEKLYDFSSVDSVNLFNGNLLISAPVGPRYSVSSTLSYQLMLVYNGKTSDLETWCEDPDSSNPDCTNPQNLKSMIYPNLRSNAGNGWRVSLGRLLPPYESTRYNDSLNDDDWVYEGPSGDEHPITVPNPHDGIRMHELSNTIREIEFASGETHKFVIENSVWRLKQMRDRFNNAVNITYTYSSDLKRELTWTVTDTAQRSHTVTFVNYPAMADGWSRGQTVSKIDFQGFNGATATYNFGYTTTTSGIPLLLTVSQPDGTQYEFATNADYDGKGEVVVVQYPTGGNVFYTYGLYSFAPQDSVCTIPFSRGVTRRTIKDGATTRVWDYQQSLGPQVPATSPYFDPCGNGANVLDGPFYWTRTSVVAPSDSNSHRVRSDHYFSVFSDAVSPSDPMAFTVTNPLPSQGRQTYSHTGAIGVPPADKRAYAVVPYVTDIDAVDDATDATPRLLSTEVYANCDSAGDCTNDGTQQHQGQLLRSTYDRYTGMVYPRNQGPDQALLVSSRTVYNDDSECGPGGNAACYTQVTSSDDNGAMAFRTATARSNFPNAQTVVTTTALPTWTAAGLADMTRPWLLDIFTEKTRTEGGVTAHEQFCFDTTGGAQSTGPLLRHRLLGGSTPLANDVLTVFDHDTSGNVQYIRSYGGDQSPRPGNSQSLGTSSALCSASIPSSPAYKTKQTFTNGVLASSQYFDPATDTALSFKNVDRDIDPSTGVVTAARDTTGLVTATLSYSAKPARLESVTLPTGATTTYTYVNATGSAGVAGFTNARVSSQTPSSSAGTLKEELVFDGLGRLFRQSHVGPQGNWFASETAFDEMGRTATVSQPESTGTNPPSGSLTEAHKTTTTYDAFNRPVLVTAPDSTTTSFQYQGVRISKKTAGMATGDVDSNVTTTNVYDQNGRLGSVTENDDGTNGQTTSYTYDVGNRLASVTQQGQLRLFHYDLRGFMLWEQHPELGASGNGQTIYGGSQTAGSYDARGHAHRKVTGSIDITTDYDPAERVAAVSETGARTLKLFAYDDPTGSSYPQCAGGKCKGKLAAAARYNYAPDLGTVAVAETYQYNGVGGLPSRRDRSIGTSSTFDGQSFFFGQTNNDLGAVASVTYPCRTDSATQCLSADRTPPTITMGYSAGMLTNVGSYASNITYQPNGVVGTVIHGSGSTAVSEVWDADAYGMARPSTIRATNGSNTDLWNSGTYAFDGSGNIKAIGSPASGGTAYYYDAFGRLTSWKTGGANSAYDFSGRRYDAFGNYLSAFQKICMPYVSGPTQRCFTTNFAAQQISGTTNRYAGMTYDEAGNVTAQSGRAFTWDPLGVMTGATSNGRTFRYLYSPDDERVAVVERVVINNVTRNLTTWSARDFSNRLLTTWTDDATSGTRTITWKEDEVWRGSTLLANLSSSGTKHYVVDHLGSPRLVTNSSGQVVGTQNFAPFGSGGSPGSGTVQFAGMERDLTAAGGSFPDLPDYDHHRFYDLDAGRFLSADPVLDMKQATRNPQGWNRYTYVMNNPLRFTDPTGTYTCTGSERECKELEMGLAILRASAAELTRRREAGATALTRLASFYGKAGDKNGVVVAVDKLQAGAGARTGTEGIGIFKTTTVTVDRDYLKTGAFTMATALAHEGDHGINQRAFGMWSSRSDYKFFESSAYRTQGYVNSALGVDDDRFGIWTKAGGADPSSIEIMANDSVQKVCGTDNCPP
jgi:RHS repeat-associated protein